MADVIVVFGFVFVVIFVASRVSAWLNARWRDYEVEKWDRQRNQSYAKGDDK